MTITPKNADALLIFTTKILIKTYPDLEQSIGFDQMLRDEKELLQNNFEGNIEAYRKYAKRKVKAYRKYKNNQL